MKYFYIYLISVALTAAAEIGTQFGMRKLSEYYHKYYDLKEGEPRAWWCEVPRLTKQDILYSALSCIVPGVNVIVFFDQTVRSMVAAYWMYSNHRGIKWQEDNL